MHPDLQHLIQLQDLDLAAERARKRLEDLPAVQLALESRIAERSTDVAGVKARIAAALAERRDIEKEHAVIQARLSKFKTQLMDVKTNKEYQAMQKEMAVAEREVRSYEDRLIEHMELAETFAGELRTAESALKREQAEVSREQAALDLERAQLEQERARLTTAREAVMAKLPADAVALFQRIAHGRKGVAVAEAREGLCTVCHVRLRPQMFNQVRRNDALNQCDSCTRILYFVPAHAPAADPPS